jgi:hypothetical protein
MAAAASTAFPPFWNIMAPAVAASGLPVMAIQWRPCSGGLKVRGAETMTALARTVISATALDRTHEPVTMCFPGVAAFIARRRGAGKNGARTPEA